jgi:hypothetical protein
VFCNVIDLVGCSALALNISQLVNDTLSVLLTRRIFEYAVVVILTPSTSTDSRSSMVNIIVNIALFATVAAKGTMLSILTFSSLLFNNYTNTIPF